MLEHAARIALIGMRGTGKSTVGRALAAVLAWNFIDTDAEIESRAQKSISEMFAEFGEPHFRELETAALRVALQSQQTVISLGGGVILREENRDLLQANCAIVLLTAPVDVLAQRIEADAASAARRPALTTCDSLIDELRALWRQREQHYHAVAHLTCDTNDRTVAEVVATIKESLLNPRSDSSR